MADEAGNLILQYLRRLDSKRDRVIDDSADPKLRITYLEGRMAPVELSSAGVTAVSIGSRFGWIASSGASTFDQPH